LAAALERDGHAAHAVDLPTDQPDLTPEEYAQIVREQAAGAVRPIVVAHSASGILLPAAARALDARHQVWLAAWVPGAEASLDQEVRRDPAAVFNPDWLGKDPTDDPAVATEFLFHDCDAETLEWAGRHASPLLPARRLSQPRRSGRRHPVDLYRRIRGPNDPA
jgi:imidazolonepropionase-like amidohydrolase